MEDKLIKLRLDIPAETHQKVLKMQGQKLMEEGKKTTLQEIYIGLITNAVEQGVLA